MNAKTALEELENYLDTEREVIRAARLSELQTLEKTREVVLAQMEDLPNDTLRLQHVRKKARRNGELLQAAANGIRSAIRRIQELRRASGPISSYSAEGEPCSIGTNNCTIERKA